MSDDRSRAAALRRLVRVHERRRALDTAEVVAVASARALKVTWSDIGYAIGMQQPAATRKFKPLLADHKPSRELTTRDDVLAELKRIRRERKKAADAEVEAVAKARDAGVTWAKIAETMGRRLASVAERFGPLIEGEPTRSERRRANEEPGRERRRTTSLYRTQS